LGVVLEEFLQPLAATLGYVARVLPAAWGPGSGLDAWHRLRVLGEGLGAFWGRFLKNDGTTSSQR
jgi:hypothetical protein